MSRKTPSHLIWDGKPLDQIKADDFVPSIVFCDLVRTHNSQMNRWVNEGNMPYKDGRNGNRECKMIKVLPLAKVVGVLRKCGMSETKLEQLSQEGYGTIAKASKKPKKREKPQNKKTAGKRPGRRPGPRPKPPVSEASPVRKYIEQATKHSLDVEKYTDIIEDAVEAGIVATV